MLTGPVNQTVSAGGGVSLPCQFTVSGRDRARVSWLKEGIPIEISDSDRYHLTDAGDSLQIRGTQLSNVTPIIRYI